MQNCRFVHFRETTTPDDEQVYFDINRDGFHLAKLYGSDVFAPLNKESSRIFCLAHLYRNVSVVSLYCSGVIFRAFFFYLHLKMN